MSFENIPKIVMVRLSTLSPYLVKLLMQVIIKPENNERDARKSMNYEENSRVVLLKLLFSGTSSPIIFTLDRAMHFSLKCGRVTISY